MSRANIDRLLKEAYAIADDNFARKGVDSSKQEVVVTRANLRNAFKEAFNKEHRKEFPDSHNPFEGDDSVFNKAASAAMKELRNYLERGGTSGELRSGTRDKIVFHQNSAVQTPFTLLKSAGIKVLQRELAKHNKKPLSPQQQLEIRKGIERLHTNTTVGTARLAYVLKFMETDPKASAFFATRFYKSLADKYGEVTTQYQIIDKAGQKSIKSIHRVSLYLAPRSKNFPGSESNDWRKIRPVLEKKLSQWLRSKDIANTPGSDTETQAGKKKAEHALMQAIKPAKYVKVTSDAKKPKKRNRASQKVISKPRKTKSSVATVPVADYVSQVEKENPAIEFKALIPVLNSMLPNTVKENMGLPRLVNRTGRFADSARIVDITKTPKGYPSIAYTYQRAPYGTFELGGRQGSTDRDPRNLIDTSIRQLVSAELAGRFFTRRV